jgi:hypothetical protein
MSRFSLLAVALIAVTASASAQSPKPGDSCQPPVSDPAAYRGCQVQDAGASLVCRCQIMPGVAPPQILVRPRVQLGPAPAISHTPDVTTTGGTSRP